MVKDSKVPGAEGNPQILRPTRLSQRGRHRPKPAMVVIDFSNAFTRGASQFPGGDFAAEMAQTRRLLAGAREHGVPVFYTTIAYADPETRIGLLGQKGALAELLQTRQRRRGHRSGSRTEAQELVIVKRFPSAFFGTDLQKRASGAPASTRSSIRLHHQRVRARNRHRCHAAQLSHDRRRRSGRRFRCGTPCRASARFGCTLRGCRTRR